MWEKDYRKLPLPKPATVLQETSGNAKKRKYSSIADALNQSYSFPLPRKAMDEFAVYMASPRDTNRDLVPSQYWRRADVRATYPTLSRMAIDVLAIPAMSSEPERIFSQAGNTLTARRNRLSEPSVEATLCLSSWGNSGLIQMGFHKQELRGSRSADTNTPINTSEGNVNGGLLFYENWLEVRQGIRNKAQH